MFKIFKIYIIYDLLVYMGSKKAYAGIYWGENGYSWNYAREIWSNTNYVKKPTKKHQTKHCFPVFPPFHLFQMVLPCFTSSRMGCRKNTYSACNAKRSRQLCMAHFHLNTCSLPEMVEYCTNAPSFQGVKMPRIYIYISVSYIDIPLRIPLNDSGFGGNRLWRRCLLGSDARHWGDNSILPTCGRNNPRASDDIYPLFSTGQFACAQNGGVLSHFGDMGLLWWFIAPPGNPPLGTLRWRFLILSYLFGALAILTI